MLWGRRVAAQSQALSEFGRVRAHTESWTRRAGSWKGSSREAGGAEGRGGWERGGSCAPTAMPKCFWVPGTPRGAHTDRVPTPASTRRGGPFQPRRVVTAMGGRLDRAGPAPGWPQFGRRAREARDEAPSWEGVGSGPCLADRGREPRRRSRAAAGSGCGAPAGPGLGVKTGGRCGGHPGPSSAGGRAQGGWPAPGGPERGGRQPGVGRWEGPRRRQAPARLGGSRLGPGGRVPRPRRLTWLAPVARWLRRPRLSRRRAATASAARSSTGPAAAAADGTPGLRDP